MKFFKYLFLVLVILCGLIGQQAAAQKEPGPELKDIIVTTSNTHLLLFATVSDSFTPEMINGVQNGLPITFTFHIDLKEIRSNWFDSTIIEKKVVHTMTYDTIKQQYKIHRSNRPENDILTEDVETAKKRMAELSGIKIISRGELQPDSPYSLGLKATLEKNTLPLGMHYVLPFTSLWDFETDWRTIEFRY